MIDSNLCRHAASIAQCGDARGLRRSRQHIGTAGSDAGSPGVVILQGAAPLRRRLGRRPSRCRSISVNGTFYGTAGGGSDGKGIVYSVTAGGATKVLHDFKGGSDGAKPQAGLIDVDGTLVSHYACRRPFFSWNRLQHQQDRRGKGGARFRRRLRWAHPAAGLVDVDGRSTARPPSAAAGLPRLQESAGLRNDLQHHHERHGKGYVRFHQRARRGVPAGRIGRNEGHALRHYLRWWTGR